MTSCARTPTPYPPVIYNFCSIYWRLVYMLFPNFSRTFTSYYRSYLVRRLKCILANSFPRLYICPTTTMADPLCPGPCRWRPYALYNQCKSPALVDHRTSIFFLPWESSDATSARPRRRRETSNVVTWRLSGVIFTRVLISWVLT